MFVSWKSQPARRTIGYTDKEREIFETAEPWDCVWGDGENVRYLHVPYGYVWDCASIPRIGWSVIGLAPSGIMDAPSLIHDVLYRTEGGKKKQELRDCKIMNENGNRIYIGRREADFVLRAAMRYAGIDEKKCQAVLAIVRAFGWRYWGKSMPAGKVNCYA